ncbi:MAG: hypothetical protein IK025_10090 [Bacteroidales bacterium]|nr:hypothetical protein [Bacteroidales bacterium]
MKKIITITLCLALVAMAGSAFGQIRPTKKPKDVNNNQLNRVSANITESNKEVCWEISGNNGDMEYRWDTEANVQRWVNEMRTQHNEVYTYKPCDNPTVESCDANNEKVNPKKCWKITGTKGGQSVEQYLWATETVARRKVTNLRNDGYQDAKYIQTPANDEKSCTPPANNPNEPACWKITIGNVVSYFWGYENDAQTTVNTARNSGQAASYELSPNKTKDSCQ